MNDEATRKFIQAIKRLMTFCQRRYPTDPSREAGARPAAAPAVHSRAARRGQGCGVHRKCWPGLDTAAVACHPTTKGAELPACLPATSRCSPPRLSSCACAGCVDFDGFSNAGRGAVGGGGDKAVRGRQGLPRLACSLARAEWCTAARSPSHAEHSAVGLDFHPHPSCW